MTVDPIGDMLIRIKNGYMAKKAKVDMPYSKVKEGLAQVLVKEGYLSALSTTGEKVAKTLSVTLKYEKNNPRLTNVVRVSKPGVRIYTSKEKIPTIYGGLGMVIVTTPQGIMSGRDAKRKGIGGEIICKIW